MKRLLIISNTAMNESSSNGRTLKNLLYSFDAEELAQFYIKDTPDFSCCKNYYQISDKTVLKAVINPLFRKSIHGKISCSCTNEVSKDTAKSNIVRSCRNLYVRNLLWSMKRWWTDDFEEFLDDFAPQAVLLYAGDAPFMFDIARLIAKKRNIPLFMYNCENYVLKKTMYAGVNEHSIWYRLLENSLKTAYSRFMNDVKYCFYISEYLENKYQLSYPHHGKSHAVYTAASMSDYRGEITDSDIFTLLYCGNLGVGRTDALLSLSKVLYRVDSKAKLKIFGSFPDKVSEERLTTSPNVEFGGRIPYEQVLEETKKCSMVIHCENPECLDDLLCAFSTKIADYLACGRPMLIYALRDYPFVQYLEQHKAAHIAADEAELSKVLSECIKNKAYREKFVGNALSLADKNHNLKKNGELVKSIIFNKDC